MIRGTAKEINSRKDARSGFEGSSLADRLEDLNAKTIFVCGPATQDCLKQTLADACQLNLQVVVLKNAIGKSGQLADTLREIAQAGALQATSSDLGIKLA